MISEKENVKSKAILGCTRPYTEPLPAKLFIVPCLARHRRYAFFFRTYIDVMLTTHCFGRTLDHIFACVPPAVMVVIKTGISDAFFAAFFACCVYG